MEKKIPKINRINLYIDEFYRQFTIIIRKNFIKELDTETSNKNLKWANEFIFRNKKPKIIVKNNNKQKILGGSIYVYLNSTFLRLWDLLYSILLLSKETQYIPSIMIQRLCYENIAHSRYFLDEITKAITEFNTKKYWELIYEFVYSEELIDDTFQIDFKNKNTLVKKLPHINESLRYYRKRADRKLFANDSKESRYKVHNLYEILTQKSHPNAIGNTKFYGKAKVFDDCVGYSFSNRHTKQKYEFYIQTEMIMMEFVNHCDYLKMFKKNLPEMIKRFQKYLETKTDDIDLYMNKYIEKAKKKFNVSEDIFN